MGTSGKDGGNVSQVETYRNGAVFTMQRNFKSLLFLTHLLFIAFFAVFFSVTNPLF